VTLNLTESTTVATPAPRARGWVELISSVLTSYRSTNCRVSLSGRSGGSASASYGEEWFSLCRPRRIRVTRNEFRNCPRGQLGGRAFLERPHLLSSSLFLLSILLDFTLEGQAVSSFTWILVMLKIADSLFVALQASSSVNYSSPIVDARSPLLPLRRNPPHLQHL